jgi:hypothetical protein
LSKIIGFPGKPEEPKGPPMGFYRVKTLSNPEGVMHYGYLIVTGTFVGITDQDSNLTYISPIDKVVEVARESLDTFEAPVH